VPGRVLIYPGTAVPAAQPQGAQRQHLRLGGIDVIDHDVVKAPDHGIILPAMVGRR
jgi:hypothetical protein